jgi:hypothetical protein
MHGGHYATLSVGRKLLGAGRVDSPSCWTDFDDAGDQQWYAGAILNKSKATRCRHDRVMAAPQRTDTDLVRLNSSAPEVIMRRAISRSATAPPFLAFPDRASL